MIVTSFLDQVGSKLRQDRPDVPSGYNYTIKRYGNIIHYWFRTQGCLYTRNKHGGCLMCDYSSSSQATSSELERYAIEGLKSIKEMSPMLLINSSGSFFDPNEVPLNVRIAIYSYLSRFEGLEVILETLIETVNRKKLIEIKKYIGSQIVAIEFGVESSNSNILKYSVNKKNVDLRLIKDKLQIIHEYGMKSVPNVLLGGAFLSEREAIDDSISTINKLFKLDVSYIVFFPVNIKPYTTVFWLYRNNLYTIVSLWSYIEVLSKINEKHLDKVELSWYKSKKSNNPLYKDEFIAPTTCPKCYDHVIDLLDQYSNGCNRKIIINKLNAIACECKEVWEKEIKTIVPFNATLKNSYRKMAIDILGESYWDSHKNEIYQEIDSDFN